MAGSSDSDTEEEDDTPSKSTRSVEAEINELRTAVGENTSLVRQLLQAEGRDRTRVLPSMMPKKKGKKKKGLADGQLTNAEINALVKNRKFHIRLGPGEEQDDEFELKLYYFLRSVRSHCPLLSNRSQLSLGPMLAQVLD